MGQFTNYVSTILQFLTNQLTLLKFIYSEKATNLCKISTVDLSYVITVKFTLEISQNFVAFSEYMNFNWLQLLVGTTDCGRSMKYFFIEIPCPCFPSINHYFYKTLSQIQIPNISLWLWFECGPQRIWDLAIVCP